MRLIHLLAVCLAVVYCSYLVAGGPANPVILIPGDGGSQIEARLHRNRTNHVYCKKTADWYTAFLNVESLLPFVLPCFVDDLMLINNASGHVRDQDGVDTRIPGFGQTDTVEYLSNTHISETEYFYSIAQALVTDPDLKYVRGQSLVGAPFDFRKVPQSDILDPYFDSLRSLIENTSMQNNNASCVLLSHSLGSTLTWIFLNRVSAEWKARYVRLWFSISPPLAGVVKTLRVMTSGDNLGVFIVNRLTIRPLQRTMPSLAFLFPQPPYWNLTEQLVFTPNRNYSMADLKQLAQDVGAPQQYLYWQLSQSLYQGLRAPAVETHCLYGTGLPTPGRLSWSTQASFPDSFPDNTPDDGDGTVNLRSLRICPDFQASQKEQVYSRVFAAPYEDGEHLRILRNPNLTSYIVTALKRSAGIALPRKRSRGIL